MGGGAARAALTHATVVNNHATQSGGGVYWAVTLNSIMYFNTAYVSWPNYFNSVCLYSCTTPDPQATGSITNDPRLVDVAAGIYRLRRDSPAVDVALETSIEKDLMGAPRALPGTLDGEPLPDMGAYEFTPVHYVSPNGGHVWPFSVWEDAAHDVQSAIDAALPGNKVFVSNGVYNAGGRTHHGALTNRVVIDKPISVIAVNGYTETVIEGRGPVGDDAVRGVYLGEDATLMGFTIRDGATLDSGDLINDQSGGGIWSESSATISNCVIESNAAHAMGGGVYGGQIINSFVHANTAAQGGGVAHADLEFCTVINNSAAEGGGAYECDGRYSIIYYNLATTEGPNVLGGAWDTCCVTPDLGGPGHIIADPQLVALNDFRLSGASPCIDAIPSSGDMPEIDLLGVPRPLDGDNSGGARLDIGAHKYIHPTADTDGDGLSDWDEVHLHGTDPTNPDTDGDGQSDFDEIIAGTDPLDPDSFFAIIHMSVEDDAQVISWPGSTGRLYTILATEDMSQEMTNHPDYTNQPGAQGTMSFTNEYPDRVNIFGVRVRLAP